MKDCIKSRLYFRSLKTIPRTPLPHIINDPKLPKYFFSSCQNLILKERAFKLLTSSKDAKIRGGSAPLFATGGGLLVTLKLPISAGFSVLPPKEILL